MNRRERRKQEKRKERQERLRREKHLRRSLPHREDEDEFEEEGPDDVESLLGSAPSMPSHFNTERVLRDLHRAIEERGIKGEEELKQFLEEYSRGPTAGRHPAFSGRADPKDRAQELAYQAMEHPDPAESARLAREALRLDPECVDALATLAGATARSTDELIVRLEEAVAVGERALGAEFFTANRGHFWGIVQTRPYMRTRAHLAELLRQTGRPAEAIGHFEALLELNPNDNQGNRDPLLGCYLAAGNLEGARRLLEDYREAGLAVFAWGRVLERYLSDDPAGAAAALEEARKKNRHVEAFLTGSRPLPEERESYYQPGGESEAVRAADFLLPAWGRHPDAVTWLKTDSPRPGAAPATGQSTSRTSAPGPAGGAPAGHPAGTPLDNFFLGEPARKWLDALLAGTDTEPILHALEPADYLPGHLLLKASVCAEILAAAGRRGTCRHPWRRGCASGTYSSAPAWWRWRRRPSAGWGSFRSCASCGTRSG